MKGFAMMHGVTRFVSVLLLFSLLAGLAGAKDQPNLLFVTVDDMNCDSVGVFGCDLAGTTPHIDQFAKQGLRKDQNDASDHS